MAEDAETGLGALFGDMAKKHDKENGNGRAVRNLIEKAKRQQALRLIKMKTKKTKDDLQTLMAEDFGIADSV